MLAIDVGSSSARAQLFDERAELAGELAQAKYDGERDPLRLAPASALRRGDLSFDELSRRVGDVLGIDAVRV